MANSLGSNPWVLDSPSGVITPNHAHIRSITWSGYANAAARCVIQGDDGTTSHGLRDILQLKGNADLSPVVIQDVVRIRQPKVSQIDGGILTIFLK